MIRVMKGDLFLKYVRQSKTMCLFRNRILILKKLPTDTRIQSDLLCCCRSVLFTFRSLVSRYSKRFIFLERNAKHASMQDIVSGHNQEKVSRKKHAKKNFASMNVLPNFRCESRRSKPLLSVGGQVHFSNSAGYRSKYIFITSYDIIKSDLEHFI